MATNSDPVLLPKINQALLRPIMNKLVVLVIGLAFAVTPTIIGATSLESVVGNTCLVPIVHTDFPIPPEGGKMIRIGNQMYFVQDYKPGCENAGANGVLIKGPQTSGATTTPSSTLPQTNSNCAAQLTN